MTEDIKMLKAKVMQFMDQEVGKYGNGRMDVKQVGELADVIKDLAEAEYYCTKAEYYYAVTEAMNGSNQDTMGYSSMGRMGYGQGSSGMSGGRQGYGSGMMGHTDPISTIRDMLSTANPEMRAQIRNDLSNLINM